MKVSEVTGYLLCGVILAAGILFFVGNNALAEDVTITTYYPAPYGVYKNLTTTEDTYLATDSGNVGIGTTSPGAKLDVAGTVEINGNLTMAYGKNFIIDDVEFGKTGTNEWIFYIKDTNSGDHVLEMTTGAGDSNVWWDTGTFGIKNIGGANVALDVIGSIEYTGTCSDVSDIRLKENFAPIEDPLEKLTTLEGFYFNMKNMKIKGAAEPFDSSIREIGLSAQDVEKVFPELVGDDEEGYKHLDYIGLIPVIVEAAKELAEENEMLRQEIKDIKDYIYKQDAKENRDSAHFYYSVK